MIVWAELFHQKQGTHAVDDKEMGLEMPNPSILAGRINKSLPKSPGGEHPWPVTDGIKWWRTQF